MRFLIPHIDDPVRGGHIDEVVEHARRFRKAHVPVAAGKTSTR
jgi:hypothetical protein